MAVTNTIANYDTLTITVIKSLMLQAAGVNVLKHFFPVTDEEAKVS
jgi:hypothetical protein